MTLMPASLLMTILLLCHPQHSDCRLEPDSHRGRYLSTSCKVIPRQQIYTPRQKDCDPIVVTVHGCWGDCDSIDPAKVVRGSKSSYLPHRSSGCKCCVPVAQKLTYIDLRCSKSSRGESRRVKMRQITQCHCQHC